MLKSGCDSLHEAMAKLFADLLNEQADPPDAWRKTRLVVLFKSGDRGMLKNYRPIAILPVLCKVYGGVLLRRIRERLEAVQFESRQASGADSVVLTWCTH